MDELFMWGKYDFDCWKRMMKPVVPALASDERFSLACIVRWRARCFILAPIRRIKQNQKYVESLYAKTLPLLALQEWSRQRRTQTTICLKSRLKKCFEKVNAGGE